MTRSIVDTVGTLGVAYTLDAAEEATPWFDAGTSAGIALITLEFSGTWNGTVTFEGSVVSDGAYLADDPVTATNINGGTTATTSTGGASAVEHWRVDLAGGLAVAVEATTLSAGSVDVTVHMARG